MERSFLFSAFFTIPWSTHDHFNQLAFFRTPQNTLLEPFPKRRAKTNNLICISLDLRFGFLLTWCLAVMYSQTSLKVVLFKVCFIINLMRGKEKPISGRGHCLCGPCTFSPCPCGFSLAGKLTFTSMFNIWRIWGLYLEVWWYLCDQKNKNVTLVCIYQLAYGKIGFVVCCFA